MFARFIASLVLSTNLIAAPAIAKITPDDAWNIWKVQAKAFGLSLDADETREGDTLQIGGMTFSAMLPMNIATLSFSFPGPRFSPDGNGAVMVSLPKKMQGSFTASIAGQDNVEATFLMTRDNENIVMSGTAEVVTSRWVADGMNFQLTGLSSGMTAFDNFKATIEFGPYRTKIITNISDTLAIDFTSENDSYNMAYEYIVGAGEDSIGESVSDSATGISSDLSFVLPLDGLRFMDLHTQLRDTLSLSLISDLTTYQTKQISTLGGTVIKSITEAVSEYRTALSLDRSGLSLEATTGPVVADVVIGAGTSKVALTFLTASIEGGLTLPLLKSDSPQVARYLMDLQGIRFNPEFWQIIDTKDALDHAPMSLRLDMSGKVNIFDDLLDFATLMSAKDISDVILPSSFNLDTLSVSALGSELSGSGTFTFDKSDMQTYDGIPRPDGNIKIRLKHGHSLLNQLVAVGLVDKEQEQAIRKTMRLYGLPGNGADTLISKIEMTPEGHIIANGQRLK